MGFFGERYVQVSRNLFIIFKKYIILGQIICSQQINLSTRPVRRRTGNVAKKLVVPPFKIRRVISIVVIESLF